MSAPEQRPAFVKDPDREAEARGPVPRWREDFPIEWEADHYITRRELTKFLTLGSALLAGVSAAIAVAGRWLRRAPAGGPGVRIAAASAVPAGGSLLFRYPTDEDPCILLRSRDGGLQAFSQVCTHLSCAIVHRPESECLYCPCHHGYFSEAGGAPVAGPPARRLPRIVIEERGDEVWAVRKEV